MGGRRGPASRRERTRGACAYLAPGRMVYAGEYRIGEEPPAGPLQHGLDTAVTYAQHLLGDERADGVLRLKQPAAALIEEADRADLLVVGSGSHSILSAMMLGSVAGAVAAQALCPVAVVRGSVGDLQPDGSPIRRAGIVVGVDGSEQSDRALEFAFEQAASRGLPIRLVHCWQPRDYVDPAYWDDERLAAQMEERRLRLNDSVAPYREKYPSVQDTAELVRGGPGPVLVHLSEDADMLVVGSRGHGVAGLLLGSVSQNVLHHAHCTVAVVRHKLPPGRESSATRRREQAKRSRH